MAKKHLSIFPFPSAFLPVRLVLSFSLHALLYPLTNNVTITNNVTMMNILI
jgi:hypothetical protein